MSKKISSKIAEGGMVAIITILTLLVCYGLSWLITCGLIKLITLCFGLAFKWNVSTGIWLVLVLVSSFLNKGKGNK